MSLKEIQIKEAFKQDQKLIKKLNCFSKLINELRKRDIPETIVQSINEHIISINDYSGTSKELRRSTQKSLNKILGVLEKELKIVPKNAYMTRWLAIGMAAFGVPLGVAFGTALDNMAFLSIGIPIGMSIGIGIGAGMDKKAAAEGRQLDLEVGK